MDGKRYEVTMVCHDGRLSKERIVDAMRELTVAELLEIRKDIVELINKKADGTNGR